MSYPTKRCTRQPAQTAEKNVMFLSSQTEPGQFIAENATQNEDHHEDIKIISFNLYSFYIFFFFFFENAIKFSFTLKVHILFEIGVLFNKNKID